MGAKCNTILYSQVSFAYAPAVGTCENDERCISVYFKFHFCISPGWFGKAEETQVAPKLTKNSCLHNIEVELLGSKTAN